MALRVCGTFLLLSLLSVQVVAAQVRQVTGRVTNASTGQGLSEATISVTGTRIVGQTGTDGNFVLFKRAARVFKRLVHKRLVLCHEGLVQRPM